MSEIKQNVRQFVVNHFLFGQDPGLTDDASFLEQGFIDSTGVLELVAFIEKEYATKVSDDELVPDNLDSITSIADFIERKRCA
ncbi:MAG: acyl carrier protein [Verrucomicrobiales bacterium]|nr:acyl carrier protein [Verrucomicrobiales bacterium]